MLVGHLEKLDSGLRELRRSADVEIHERLDLRAWTGLGVGGVAAVVVRCHSEVAVRSTLDLAASHGLGWLTLGGGSRLVVSDRGLRVPVLSLTGELARWEPEVDGIVAGGGANLAQVCRAASRAGLTGLESCGDRGHSVGGLVEAAVNGVVDIEDALDWLDVQRPGARVERWRSAPGRRIPSPEEFHRRVVLRARFRLRASRLGEIRRRQARTGVGGLHRSAGPVFLDARDASAADLLAEAGCGNAAVGGVRLGGPHGNSLVAGRSASASDVFELCRLARKRVSNATGVVLETALVFVDEDGRSLEL